MSKGSTRRARIIGGALASAALAFTLLLPAASASVPDGELGGLKIGVDRNCVQVDDSQGNCIYQTSIPSGDQDVFQWGGDTENSAEPYQKVDQDQDAFQLGGAAVVSVAEIGDIKSEPRLEVRSGSVDVDGNKQTLFLFAPQIANAGPKVEGDIRQETNTGSSDTYAAQWGDTVSAGGFAGAYQSSRNEIEAEADQAANNGTDLFSLGGDSGRAYAGDGGDVKGGGAGDGGFNLAFALQEGEGGGATGGSVGDTVAVNVAAALSGHEVEGADENNSAGGATGATSGETRAISRVGAAFGGFGLAATDQDQSANGGYVSVAGQAGYGGDATSGTAGSAGGNFFQPQPVNQNVLTGNNTQTASGTATGGDASSGDALGHSVVGGVSGNNQSEISLSGGVAVNNLTVTPSVSGSVSGYSGNVSNSGSATSNIAPVFNQGGTATNNQTQSTTQSGQNNSSIGPQTSTGGTQTASPTQNVRSGELAATASNTRNWTNTDD